MFKRIKKMRLFQKLVLAVCALVIILDFMLFIRSKLFLPRIIIAVTIGWLQCWIDFFIRQAEQKQIDQLFPEFVRNLVNSVKSGMPVPLAVSHVADRDYRSLTKHVRKLANQLDWNIPLHKALMTFAEDTGSDMIKRSVVTVIEAEKSGGNIEDVLDSVTASVVQVRKMRSERKAAIYAQVVQSYIIFFVFIAVMIVIMNSLVPYLSLMQGTSLQELGSSGVSVVRGGLADLTQKVEIDFSSVPAYFKSMGRWFVSMKGIFFMLAVIQGAFSGLAIGKLSEGRVAAGLKHSLILMTAAALVMSIALG
jgi:flagellar protein FlaJ